MTRLSLLADEHVPSAVITALSSNGFDVVAVAKERAGIDDKAVLSLALNQRRVILTNDRDFVLLADQRDHAGILLYTQSTPKPGNVTRAVRRIDRLFEEEAVANELLWLEDWL